MISNHMQRMREKLRTGKIVLGAGITLADPAVVAKLRDQYESQET